MPCPQGPRTCRPPFHTPPQHNRQVQEPFEARSHRDHVNRAKRTDHPALLDPEVGERYRALITFMTKLGTDGVKQWRRRQVRYWTRQARRLEGKRQEWVRHMPEHIRAVAGHLHLPLLEKMLQESDYPDKTLIQDFRRGFPVMGRLPGSGVYPAEDPLPEPELD